MENQIESREDYLAISAMRTLSKELYKKFLECLKGCPYQDIKELMNILFNSDLKKLKSGDSKTNCCPSPLQKLNPQNQQLINDQPQISKPWWR